MSAPRLGRLLDLAAAPRYAAELRDAGAAGGHQRLSSTCSMPAMCLPGRRPRPGRRPTGGAQQRRLHPRLKGPGGLWCRSRSARRVLLALRAVDAVLIFDEPTAGPLLAALRPPIYVKGGDYALADAGTGTPLPEEPVVRAFGGEIDLIPYLEGRSTSALIARIRA